VDIIAPNRSQQLELMGMLQQAIDPDGRIPAAIQAMVPLEGRSLLEVGAGAGDRSLQYARVASQVYALEQDARLYRMLRGRIKSARLANVTPLLGGPTAIPLDDGSVDIVYALWTGQFGTGGEPGLRTAERVVRPAGHVIVAENYGRDDLSELWTAAEAECETWPPWFEARGYGCQVVETWWRFQQPEDAQSVIEALWGARARERLASTGQRELRYRVALYHKQIGDGRPAPAA
jgi:SAM-dependent methyltransferase